MSLQEKEIEELAALLPDDFSFNNARERLLCVIALLKTLTDNQHILSNADIRAILNKSCKNTPRIAENTLGADLKAIRESNCLGLNVHTTPKGIWVENANLEPANIRLLLNAVQSSRFLTYEQSASLQQSLLGLVSRYQEETMERQVFVNQRVRKSSQSVFATCDAIAEALRLGRKIEFEYTFNDFDGNPVALKSDAGEILRIETPLALLFSEDNYYLESYADIPWRHNAHIMRSRVDRMYQVRVSDKPATDNQEVRRAKQTVKQRLEESIDMVGGKSRIVFLRVRADQTNVMFDRFGFGLRYAQFKGTAGSKDTTGLTCVKVNQSFTFFRWLSAAKDGIVIVKPGELEFRSGPWNSLLRGVNYAQVVADYQAMKQNYLEYLEDARKPYADQ